MTRIIIIFLNIAICFLTIVSKKGFGGQNDLFVFLSRNDISDDKDTISLDFQDDFENGNFAGWYPEEGWTVSESDPIGGEFSLKHATSSAGGVSAIFRKARVNLETEDVQWSFKLKNGGWDPSSSNRFWFYLVADTIVPEMISGWAVGVNMKGSTDMLQLWRFKNGNADSLIIQTDFDWNAAELVSVAVRRTSSGNWTLDFQREGDSTAQSFSGTDPNLCDFRNVGLFFQFTSTRSGQLWLDDVSLSHSEAALFIQKTELINSNTVSLIFNRPILPSSVKEVDFKLTNEFDEEISISQVIQQNEKEVQLRFESFQGTELSLSVSGIYDLFGHMMTPDIRTIDYSFSPEPGSVLINEILFNPFPGGVDFVELVNVSENAIPVSRLKLAARNDTMGLKQIYQVTTAKKYLFPGEFLVCTKDTEVLASQYITSAPKTFCTMKLMPSFPDDAGAVVLLNDSLIILDEFSYSAKMHSPFLADDDGVSLERISLEIPSNDRTNWASAAASVGFATPGMPNSQAVADSIFADEISVEPKAFSPNGDGYNDLLSIKYQFRKPGYMANVRIFDLAGRPVNYLSRNESLGQTGIWIWNGENRNGQRLNLGVYIILVEIFDQDGNAKAFKKTCTLTDRLN